MSTAPSTDWKEIISPDEQARFEGHARVIREVQAAASAKYGQGRALHRKAILALKATLTVDPGRPAWCRHGVFEAERSFDVLVRLSNGSMFRQRDATPDARGFALKLAGASGPGALGFGDVDEQDFLLIQHPAFSSPTSEEFMGIVAAAARGQGALIAHIFRRHGLGAFKVLKGLAAMQNRPFSGFATADFFTPLPFACGPYAAKMRLRPTAPHRAPGPAASADWAADFRSQLARGPLTWSLELQPFVSEALTPIERADALWSGEFSPVATLTVAPQAPEQALDDRVEQAKFDPWNGLALHRPLGEVQRARKVTYYESQKGRGLG